MHTSGIGMGEILVLVGLAGMAGTAALAIAAVLVAIVARCEEAQVKNRRESGG